MRDRNGLMAGRGLTLLSLSVHTYTQSIGVVRPYLLSTAIVHHGRWSIYRSQDLIIQLHSGASLQQSAIPCDP